MLRATIPPRRGGLDFKVGASQGGRFKLREILLAQEASKLLDDMYCFSCDSISAINTDALCYFALSVIWRASVATWDIDGM